MNVRQDLQIAGGRAKCQLSSRESEARDLRLAANCRSLASLGMTNFGEFPVFPCALCV